MTKIRAERTSVLGMLRGPGRGEKPVGFGPMLAGENAQALPSLGGEEREG